MGLFQKVGNFLGINKFGEGIATAGRVLTGQVGKDIATQNRLGEDSQKILYVAKQEKDPVKKAQLLKLANQTATNSVSVAPEKIDPGINLKPKEIIGSAANVGLNILTPGAFKGSSAAVVGKNALLGAGFGAASGLEKNRSTSGIIGSAVGGTLVGAAVGGATVGTKVLKDFLTKTTPEWLMNNAVKPTLDEARKTVKFGSDTIGQELLAEGVHGKPETLLKIANEKMNSLEDELQNTLNNAHLSGATILRKDLIPFGRDIIAQQKKIPGSAGNVQRIKDVFKSIPETMTLQQANEMKRAIYQELRSPAYKLDAKLSTKASALKMIAKGLKTEIENQVGGNIVKEINGKLSLYGRLEDRIMDQLARSMHGFSLTDAILASGGLATGNPLGFLSGLGLAGLRHIGSALETGTAVGLNKLQNVGEGITAKGASEVLRRGALNVP